MPWRWVARVQTGRRVGVWTPGTCELSASIQRVVRRVCRSLLVLLTLLDRWESKVVSDDSNTFLAS